MFEALINAWGAIVDPVNLMFLAGGVLMGLALGAIPGLGGVIGLTILIPFVYDLSPAASLSMLIGMAAVTTTSDSIPAILFGIPGTVAAQATILDGYPMAKRGEAARALGASFSSAALGGVFGAIVLFVSIPILRPIVLNFRSPEFFMLALLGISMVAVLSRGAVAKGLAAGGFGLLLTCIGQDPVSGEFRYVYDLAYLWEGLPIGAVALGLFAIPELVDMAIGGKTIAISQPAGSVSTRGKWQGVGDCFRNWFGVLRSSAIGVFVGVIPGLGATVVDWFAYGIAKQTSRNSQTFGTGDVRGIIAVDAAANAKEGGALVTTVAFGVPGSVTMALLLTAFQIQNLTPGPLMLTTQVESTLTLVWALVIANIIATALCFTFVAQIARVATIPVYRIFPVLIVIIFLGGFQGQQDFGELITLVVFGFIGWIMKRAGWPRPALILGFILGSKIQETLFLSIGRYGTDWFLEPLPFALGVLSVASIAFGIFYQPGIGRLHHGRWTLRPQWSVRTAVTIMFAAATGWFLLDAQDFGYQAWLFPTAIAVPTFAIALFQLLRDVFSIRPAGAVATYADIAPDAGESPAQVRRGGTEAFAWVLGLLAAVWLVGFPVSMVAFLLAYLRVRARESWPFSILVTAAMVGLLYLFFENVLHVVWPKGILGIG